MKVFEIKFLMAAAIVSALTITNTSILSAQEETDGSQHETKEAAMPRTPSPEGAAVNFVSAEASHLSGEITIKFGITNMNIAPAGDETTGTGHHHLIIDAPLPDLNAPIPNNVHYRHFDGGETEVTFKLEPGEHTLQLLLGDWSHIPHETPVHSKAITIKMP